MDAVDPVLALFRPHAAHVAGDAACRGQAGGFSVVEAEDVGLLGGDGVVASEQADPGGPGDVGARVAHVGDVDAVGSQLDRREHAAHARAGAVTASGRAHPAVGFDHRVRKGQVLGKGVPRQGRRHLARRLSPHAIDDGEAPTVGLHQQAVLVGGAHAAPIRAGGDLDPEPCASHCSGP